uniref:Odorant binding protein n=1 Tax=Eogystia hippophaecolus TaxID=1206364 RepID=A0A1B3P5K3_EOGHI|nr:odorant binding protein [Eogystia hippophaecolus]
MASFYCVFLCYGIVALYFINVNAVSQEEIIKIEGALLPFITECSAQNGVNMEDLTAAKKNENYDNLNPCLIACVFKKTGTMDDKGLFNLDKALEKTKKFLKSEEDIDKAAEVAKSCASVNDQEISDNDKSCGRAKLLLDCFIKHKGQFPLSI